MTSTLDRLYSFMQFSARLREVQRHNRATPDRAESVAEHSWHLALICWLLRGEFEREFGTPVDLDKMIKMCLLHDLVEIDTGDPSAWRTDGAAEGSAEAKRQKALAEEQSAQQRFGSLPEPIGSEMLAVWHEHEAGQTLEARLVRAVDRLNPALMRHLTGQGWSDVGATAADLDNLQLPRLSVSTTLTGLYQRVRAAAVESGQFAIREEGVERQCR
ncbi:HD domain-containing protein [Crossiella sp. CA-258035]|uniref:HD domain-containing protein n=1 Tax=Crossiella sp. CA-258035 TaxID=2981138 RepID=UPI0024BC47B4|nr:HD domain-containing protein [Crossiella sp. CA-258035]WHT22942.1 HD domain-containing protein [Crossiella sp. CA-258035]